METNKMSFGTDIHFGEDGNRIKLSCAHHNAILYTISAESNWVCNKESLHVHAIAGFFKDLTKLDDKNVDHLMQKWGIYYRETPLIS
jgi:hypothetical protein|tara:strand:- start:1056 stop:1316 length:261 start_codon:yes stop_codon:yes gene_type:complete